MIDKSAATPAPAGEVRLVALTKRIDDVLAVAGIDLHIAAGEFFSLLGPSGCGKTTTLRMIAGFEPPTSGAILLDGSDVSRVPAHLRDVNMVFQSFALFPHRDVFHNVAYGLRRHGMRGAELRSRVAAALELVQLPGLGRRRPAQLSGGQQQRVALARALVLRPAVLLLDEPLGSLDARLRKQLQVELKTLQEQVGITFVFVTHDQEEALSMSDRIAVMNAGHIEQVGTPRTLYEKPGTPFVANFLGVSNLMEADVEGGDADDRRLRIGAFRLRARGGSGPARGRATIVVRPERVRLESCDAPSGENRLPGLVARTVYLGSAIQVVMRLATGSTLHALIANTGDAPTYPAGTPVRAFLPADAIRVLGVESPAVDSPGETASADNPGPAAEVHV
jgi:spermidine/putrescine transport system ATP-binding protein